MFNKMKDVNIDVANKQLDRERNVGIMMGMFIGLFFLTYVPLVVTSMVCLIVSDIR